MSSEIPSGKLFINEIFFTQLQREESLYWLLYIYIYIPFKEIKNYMEIILTPNKDIF